MSFPRTSTTLHSPLNEAPKAASGSEGGTSERPTSRRKATSGGGDEWWQNDMSLGCVSSVHLSLPVGSSSPSVPLSLRSCRRSFHSSPHVVSFHSGSADRREGSGTEGDTTRPEGRRNGRDKRRDKTSDNRTLDLDYEDDPTDHRGTERNGVNQRKVDRVLANHSLSSTASQGRSNIPLSFLLLGLSRQARRSVPE